MAFENIHSSYPPKRLYKLEKALRRMIPAKFLLVGIDTNRSSPDHKHYAIFYDRDSHQAEYDSPGELERRRAFRDLPAISAPPYHDRLQSFIDGFLAARSSK